jgi:hypothetical protein
MLFNEVVSNIYIYIFFESGFEIQTDQGVFSELAEVIINGDPYGDPYGFLELS